MKNRVLEFILKKGSISTKQAFEELGTTDLQHYIMVLRRDGHNIKDTWIKGENRFGDKVQWKKYYIEKDN